MELDWTCLLRCCMLHATLRRRANDHSPRIVDGPEGTNGKSPGQSLIFGSSFRFPATLALDWDSASTTTILSAAAGFSGLPREKERSTTNNPATVNRLLGASQVKQARLSP